MRLPIITVLHVDSTREHRGDQIRVRLLMAGLARRPCVRQALIAPVSSRLTGEAAELGIDVRPAAWRAAVDPRALTVLHAGFADDWDVVHAHDEHAVRSVLLARALSGGRAPVVASRRLDARPGRVSTWRRADLVIADSRRVRDVLVTQGLERRRVEVVTDGVDPSDATEVRRYTADAMIEGMLRCYRALSRQVS
jgi:hypothetical protein